ncbi:hypothetical protein [Calidifontibacillus erzurumensis]|uniref:Uncharacterized protein n=1 Tax=Calidifontibacillus erzurumensis TaxID=2741433 RepID=A0A8J8KD01_9BACI|nr:hypothetical protein [Calidifontibacillus erzurumensis]NSL53122.1 hypothetical protein [Calidifontibacillus erzurumensis]
MKEFIGIFLVSIIICWMFAIFFIGFIVENAWVLIIFIAFVLAVIVTIFIKLVSRIEDLERKVEKLLNNKQD